MDQDQKINQRRRRPSTSTTKTEHVDQGRMIYQRRRRPSTSTTKTEHVDQDRMINQRRRRPPTSITKTACSACQKRRSKCNGESPCSRCAIQPSPACVYMMNSKVAKEDMQREITELQRTNMLFTNIFDALRSDRHVPMILKMLKAEEDPSLIADVANSPQGIQFNINSLLETNEDIFQDTCDSRPYESVQATKQALAPVLNQINYSSTTPCHQLLIQHLLTLYWTWIHPAHPLFSMEFFIQDYMTGTAGHSSAFLVAAVCAAACDLLSPPWINILGKGFDVVTLRQNLVAEASKQETLADPNAQTTLRALQVMRIVDCRSETPYAKSIMGYRQCGMDLDKQVLPEIKK